jgi:hypothetical protein
VAIAFVASDEGNSDTDATSYSIAPLPTGTTAGNVAIVVVACPETGTETDAGIVFSGWAPIYIGRDNSVNFSAHRVSVWFRVVQSGDTESSAFTFDNRGTAEGIAWVCCEYSGVDTGNPFWKHDGAFSVADADQSLATPTLANPDADAWWVSAAGIGETAAASSSTATWSADIGTERNDIDAGETSAFHAAAMYDSNATVAKDASVTVTHTYSVGAGGDVASWLGILRPSRVNGTLSGTVN